MVVVPTTVAGGAMFVWLWPPMIRFAGLPAVLSFVASVWSPYTGMP